MILLQLSSYLHNVIGYKNNDWLIKFIYTLHIKLVEQTDIFVKKEGKLKFCGGNEFGAILKKYISYTITM